MCERKFINYCVLLFRVCYELSVVSSCAARTSFTAVYIQESLNPFFNSTALIFWIIPKAAALLFRRSYRGNGLGRFKGTASLREHEVTIILLQSNSKI